MKCHTLFSDISSGLSLCSVFALLLPVIFPVLAFLDGAKADYQVFEESKLGNDLFISDPDRADRIHNAAEHGCDGSTHAERIDDWREYADQIREEAMREAWRTETEVQGETMEREIEAWHDKLTAEIDACEAWHKDNGSLNDQGS